MRCSYGFTLVLLTVFACEAQEVEGVNSVARGEGIESISVWGEPAPRMTPLSEAVSLEDQFRTPAQTVAVMSDQPISSFNLGVRPPEFSFTELFLNTRRDPLLTDCQAGGDLHLALGLLDFRLLDRLLEMGADPNTTLSQPIQPGLSRLFPDEQAVFYLKKESGISPLMLAVMMQRTDVARLLLQYGADAERIHTKKFHMYPLDFAAQRNNIRMMQMLLGRRSPTDLERRHVVISLSNQVAQLWQGGSRLFASQVSTGRPGFRTPPGEYVVTQKYKSWKSTLYKVPMPNFMRLSCSAIGMHGGYVPDVPASHGCIRLPPEKAAMLYGIIEVGDRVTIIDSNATMPPVVAEPPP